MDEEQRRREAGGRGEAGEDGGRREAGGRTGEVGGRRRRGEAEACMISLLILMNT